MSLGYRINATDLRIRTPEVLALVRGGESFEIEWHRQLVAKIIPLRQSDRVASADEYLNALETVGAPYKVLRAEGQVDNRRDCSRIPTRFDSEGNDEYEVRAEEGKA